MNKFKYYKLGEYAEIELSGVDKKSNDNETKVLLCNFTDVYKNWYIRNNLIPDFMTATANQNEIDKFELKKGQVAITKDSETRDDIGVSTYITNNFNKVILGYHCALITPKEDLNGNFLNGYFHTKTANILFSYQATGSGQRYTLTKNAIENIKIPLPPLPTQEKIANVLSALDDKIELNNRTNKKLEEMARTIYDYWFLQFDFPNEEGKPYKSSGGSITYNSTLKREIPTGWEVVNILDLIEWRGGSQPPKSEHINYYKDGYVRFIQNRDYANKNHITYIPISNVNKICDEYDIMIDKYGDAGETRFGIAGAYNVALSCIKPKRENIQEYIRLYLSSSEIKNYLSNSCMASTRASLNESNISFLNVVLPNDKILALFERNNKDIINKILYLKKENRRLSEIRDFLLPMLMNGQIEVK